MVQVPCASRKGRPYDAARRFADEDTSGRADSPTYIWWRGATRGLRAAAGRPYHPAGRRALIVEVAIQEHLNTTDTKDAKVKTLPFVYVVSFVFNSRLCWGITGGRGRWL